MPIVTRSRARKYCQQCPHCDKACEEHKDGEEVIQETIELYCSQSASYQRLKEREAYESIFKPLLVGCFDIPTRHRKRKLFTFHGDFYAPDECPFALEMMLEEDKAHQK